MVDLVRAGRSPEELAREFEPTARSIGIWVTQADKQEGRREGTAPGLRATGPVALKLLGFENRAIRALTGHTSDSNLETYLRGVDHYPLAQKSQEALQKQFAQLLVKAGEGGNARRFTGVTGRAAARAKALPESVGAVVQQPSNNPTNQRPTGARKRLKSLV